jgi:protein required for attachment to host cells
LIDRESILGGQKVEGVVAKNYERFGKDGKVLMAKFVSSKFKEVHDKDWKKRNPAGIDIITKLGLQYHSEARFAKAVQHMKEDGVLLGEPRDIGGLIKGLKKDVYEECAHEIKETLFAWAWPKIQRAVVSGLPEWYKQLLIEETFIETED